MPPRETESPRFAGQRLISLSSLKDVLCRLNKRRGSKTALASSTSSSSTRSAPILWCYLGASSTYGTSARSPVGSHRPRAGCFTTWRSFSGSLAPLPRRQTLLIVGDGQRAVGDRHYNSLTHLHILLYSFACLLTYRTNIFTVQENNFLTTHRPTSGIVRQNASASRSTDTELP
jgi:hypothetical protein